MVSSVLAQAILDQNAPDIVGAFKEGQREAREAKTRELAGQAITTGQIDPLLAEISPDIAFSIGEQIRARNARDISDFMRDAQIAKYKLDAGDTQGALQFSMQRRNAIRNRGGDTTQTDAFISTLQNNPEQARQELNAFLGSVDQTKPSALVEFETLTAGLSPEETERAKRIRLGLEARQGITAEQIAERERLKLLAQRDIRPEIKGLEEAEKGISKRKQGFIDAGVDAADSVGNIRRSLELLDTVKTGGISAASLRAKQLFGVEGADEGELSANLGRSVLAQLKPIFGAAFTAAEGERLERIEAGFGRSAATNRRLLESALKTAERAAKRGMAAAKEQGDDFTAQEIERLLETTEAAREAVQAPQEVQQAAPTQVLQFDAQGNLVQ